MINYTDLSTDDLAKLINEEYSVILHNERTNLPRAQMVGEKLKVLQDKAEHGEWKTKLAEYCPEVAYETATLYIRLWNKREKLAELAAAKDVTVTDLTIQEARKLLATPKSGSDGSRSKKAIKAAVEPASGPEPRSVPPDQVIRNLELDYGDMFETLKSTYDQDDLMSLTERLAAHLGMTLMPTGNSDALKTLLNIVSEPASA